MSTDASGSPACSSITLHLGLGYLVIWHGVFRQRQRMAAEGAEAKKRRESWKESHQRLER